VIEPTVRASARPVRLVVVAYTDLPSDARVLREAREAVRRGLAVTVVVPRTGDVPPRSLVPGGDVVWLDTAQQRGRTTVRGQLAFIRAMRAWVHRQKSLPDVVHVHNMPDYLYWAVRHWHRAGARVVLDVHDIMSELALHRFRGVRGRVASLLLKPLERAVWRRVDALITVHTLYADAIRGAIGGQDPVYVIINAPEPDVCRPELRRAPVPGRFKIVFHGTVSERTGVAYAVRAMPQLLRYVPEARLLIVGSGNGVSTVQGLRSSLGLEGVVEFVDRFLPVDQVISRIADADAAVVPNEVSRYTRAILPVKLLEYATLGIPVVATRLPVIEAYFNDTAFHFVSEPAPSLIADGLRRLHRDVAYRESLSRRAQDLARQHGWRRYSEVLARALLGASPRLSETPPVAGRWEC
jgi:glycosyltransferase involved in cell wall biosynthesis